MAVCISAGDYGERVSVDRQTGTRPAGCRVRRDAGRLRVLLAVPQFCRRNDPPRAQLTSPDRPRRPAQLTARDCRPLSVTYRR